MVAEAGRTLVRAAVDEDLAGLIRERGGPVTARFADALATVVPARVEEETPAAGRTRSWPCRAARAT